MIFEISARGVGKSSKMAAMAKASGGHLLVFSDREKERIILEFEFNREHVHTMDDLESLRWRGKVSKASSLPLYIDNLDMVMNYFLVKYGYRLAGASFNGN